MRELTFGQLCRQMFFENLIITRGKLMLAEHSKISEGRGRTKRSRGSKPLLRKRILLDFLVICAMNISSIKHNLESLTSTKLRRIILLRGHSFLNHLTPPPKGLLSLQGGDQKGR